jgi:hypothetical protein
MVCDPIDSAVLFVDPLNAVLSPTGKNWRALGVD